MSDREALAMPSFDDMDDFAPRATAGQGGQAAPSPAAAPVVARSTQARRAIDAVSQFPSREVSTDGQLNLKGPREVLDRFRKLCKDDRRAYYDMLTILMDRYEGK